MREGLKLLSGFSGTASYLLWNLRQEAEWTRAGRNLARASLFSTLFLTPFRPEKICTSGHRFRPRW